MGSEPDDDDIKFNEHADGSYDWTDSSGTHGSVSSSGAQVFNPDGSGTAMDLQGNETKWDADGNFDGADPYAGLGTDGTGAGISAGDDYKDTAYEDANTWDAGDDSKGDDSSY